MIKKLWCWLFHNEVLLIERRRPGGLRCPKCGVLYPHPTWMV